MEFMIENFDLTNEFNILRIICGAFFIPHIAGKFLKREFTLDFFTKVGLNPPAPYVYLCLALEVPAALGLILGIYTTYAALFGVIVLASATIAVMRISSFEWFWNFGGFEYPLFWMIACMVVALHG